MFSFYENIGSGCLALDFQKMCWMFANFLWFCGCKDEHRDRTNTQIQIICIDEVNRSLYNQLAKVSYFSNSLTVVEN